MSTLYGFLTGPTKSGYFGNYGRLLYVFSMLLEFLSFWLDVACERKKVMGFLAVGSVGSVGVATCNSLGPDCLEYAVSDTQSQAGDVFGDAQALENIAG